MTLRWVPANPNETPGAEQDTVDAPTMAVQVGSADVLLGQLKKGSGQPSPNPGPSSPPDEDFMDAQDMEGSKALNEAAKRPPVPTVGRTGPVVDYTPGHPPSWHFKQLFRSEESGDEEESSGVFPTMKTLPAVAADPSLKSRPIPPRPQPRPAPVALAYSSSPHASRRAARERKRSSSPEAGSGGQGHKPDPAPTTGGGGGGRAPVSSTTAGAKAAAAPAASDPWFSSSSVRADEKAAAKASIAAARGTISGHHQRVGAPSTSDGDVFHMSRSEPSTDPFVASAAGAAAGARTTEQEEQGPRGGGKQAAASQGASQGASNGGQQQALHALEPLVNVASPTSQSSPRMERTMSFKAAAILGVPAPGDAGNKGTGRIGVGASEDGGSARNSPPRRALFRKALTGSLPFFKKEKVPPSPGSSLNVSVPVALV